MQSLSQGRNRSILASAVLSGYILADLGLSAIALTTQETLTPAATFFDLAAGISSQEIRAT